MASIDSQIPNPTRIKRAHRILRHISGLSTSLCVQRSQNRKIATHYRRHSDTHNGYGCASRIHLTVTRRLFPMSTISRRGGIDIAAFLCVRECLLISVPIRRFIHSITVCIYIYIVSIEMCN